MSETSLIQVQAFIDAQLQPQQFKDYCPNGLQVQGKPTIGRIALGVTASMAVIEQASQWGADALLVHHGYFWKGESPTIVGIKARRLKALWAADMNLLAYHLPLDVHTKWGNNVQLAERLGWVLEASHRVDGVSGLVCSGRLAQPQSVSQLADVLTQTLGHRPLVVGPEQPEQGSQKEQGASSTQIERIAWCTGAAQRYLQTAIDLGVDAYLSGEISENTVHLAREAGVYYLACGHHATEKYGVQALGAALATEFGIAVQFFDEPNPV